MICNRLQCNALKRRRKTWSRNGRADHPPL